MNRNRIKMVVLLSTILVVVGCSTKELSINEINKLHEPYSLTDRQIKDIAKLGCSYIEGGKGKGIVLGEYANTNVDVNLLGEIEKTYTSNPLGSNDIFNGTLKVLNGEKIPIYKGACEIMPVTKFSNVRTGVRSEHVGDWHTYYFIINPKSCLTKGV